MMAVLSNFIHSVRFRLTAWYGFLMVVVLVVAGFGAWILLGTWLRGDLDDQLKASARTYSDPANLSDLLRDSTELDGPEVDAEDGAYKSLIVQLADPVGSFRITPFDCRIPFRLPADADPGTAQYSTQEACGDTFRVLAVNDVVRNPQTGSLNSVILAQSLTPLNDTLETLRNLMLAIGGLGILLALQGGWLIAGRALRPISSVTDTASTIAESPQTEQSLVARLPLPRGNDEVAQLTMTFNRMMDRIEAEFGRRQRFVADASHELRTPLAAIRGNLDVLSIQLRRARPAPANPADADRQVAIDEGFDDLTREAGRMARLLDDLLFLARADDVHSSDLIDHGPVRLDDVAGQTVRSAAALVTGQRLETNLAPVTVKGDRDRLTQLLWILLDNALRHTGPGERIVVTVAEEAGEAVMTVRDEGSGIAAADLPHVFDRFFRADEARSRASGGSGLGLAIARTIVEQSGGEIVAASQPGQSSTFTVRLPLVPENAADRGAVAAIGGEVAKASE